MAEATAWLLALAPELQAAVGEKEMIHMVQTPALFEIPDTPAHCRQVLRWEQQIVPVLDVADWLLEQPAAPSPAMVGVFAYQIATGIGYGALPLQAVPARRRVRDDQACPLPERPAGWSRIALSCFSDGDRKIPILDLNYLFSNALLY